MSVNIPASPISTMMTGVVVTPFQKFRSTPDNIMCKSRNCYLNVCSSLECFIAIKSFQINLTTSNIQNFTLLVKYAMHIKIFNVLYTLGNSMSYSGYILSNDQFLQSIDLSVGQLLISVSIVSVNLFYYQIM